MSCRRSVALLALAAVVACSSNNPVIGSEGEVATRLAITAGDGQSAAPGTSLPTSLAVMVHDSAGKGVPGVVVHFSVDSGGGSVAASSATTGSDGTASAGKWTLGPASATTNVVTASAGSLAPVKFHAQSFGATARTLLDNAPVPAAGGDLVYHKPGDALDGLTVSVSPGAYPLGATWSIVADSSSPVPLPAEFSQVGPTLIVSSGQGYADSNVAITMPMNVPAGDAVAPFYFDPVTGTLEAIPLVGRSATSATLAARHFSVDLMAIPGSVPTSLRAPSLRTFGSVRIVWVRLPAASLSGTFTSGFQVQQDNWEFSNNGDYLTPAGICEGMSVTEIYYYYFVTQTGRPSLYHHFDASLTNPWDNVQGLRLAGSVQYDYDHFAAGPVRQESQLDKIAHNNGLTAPTLAASWIALTLKLTHKPVLLGLYGPAGGHAVIAYAATISATSTVVSFADPNAPKANRTLTFNGATLVPVQVATNANVPPADFTTAIALGVTAEVPLRQVDTRWIDFLAKQAGKELYPSDYTYQYHDSLTDNWIDLAKNDTIKVSQSAIRFRFNCPGCETKLVGQDDVQFMTTYKDSGTTKIGMNDVTLPLSDTQTYLTVIGIAFASVQAKDAGYFDSQNFTVISKPFKIVPADLHGRTDTAYTFTATNGGLAEADTKFTWSFGDQTTNANVTGDSAIKHTFADTGKFIVRAQMRDANGILFGVDSTVVTISNGVSHAWTVTSATLANTTPPAHGTGTTKVDTLVTNAITEWINSITQQPTLTTVVVTELLDKQCGAVTVNQVGSTITGTDAPGQTDGIAILADNCADPDGALSGSFALGPIGAGTLVGAANLKAPGNGPAGGSINAVMSGTSLTGTIHFRMQFTTGLADYAVQFTAVQLLAPGQPGLRQRVTATGVKGAGPRQQ